MNIPAIKFINSAYEEVRHKPSVAAHRFSLAVASISFGYVVIEMGKKAMNATHNLGFNINFSGSSSAYLELGCMLLSLTACAIVSVKTAQRGYNLTATPYTKPTMLSQ